MAHVGQEGALAGSGLLGLVLGQAQVQLHGVALAEIVDELDDASRCALGIKNGVVGGVDPDVFAVLAHAVVFTAAELALTQGLPVGAVIVADHFLRQAQQSVVLPDQFMRFIAHQLQKFVTGAEDATVQVELDHHQRPVDGLYHALEVRVAQLGVGDVHQDAVHPPLATLCIAHGGRGFGHPVLHAAAAQHPVLQSTGARLGQRLLTLALHPLTIGGVDQGVQLHLTSREGGHRPAGEGLGGIADEHEFAPALVTPVGATEGDTGDVGDQAAVLMLALGQRVLDALALSEVGHKGHPERLFGIGGLAQGEPDGQQAAIQALGRQFTHARHQTRMGWALGRITIAAQVGQQQLDGAARELGRRRTKDLFGRRVDRQDHPLRIHADHTIGGRVQDGLQPGLTAREVPIHLTVAQGRVDRRCHGADQQGDEGDGERQAAVSARIGHKAGLFLPHKAGSRHGGVMHARNRQAHDPTAQCDGLPGSQPTAPRQLETDPQRQHRQRHGHHQRGSKPTRVVTQHRGHLERGHAAVMHQADAHPHQSPTHQKLPSLDLTPRQHPKRHIRSPQAGQHRSDGDGGRVAYRGAQLEGQHANEVHGPHPGAQ